MFFGSGLLLGGPSSQHGSASLVGVWAVRLGGITSWMGRALRHVAQIPSCAPCSYCHGGRFFAYFTVQDQTCVPSDASISMSVQRFLALADQNLPPACGDGSEPSSAEVSQRWGLLHPVPRLAHRTTLLET